jgi:hypothetical protein
MESIFEAIRTNLFPASHAAIRAGNDLLHEILIELGSNKLCAVCQQRFKRPFNYEARADCDFSCGVGSSLMPATGI